jgi:hypothetical protein
MTVYEAIRTRAVLALSLAFATASRASAADFTVGGGPRVDPADFRIANFGQELDFPMGLLELPDGGLPTASNSSSRGRTLGAKAR